MAEYYIDKNTRNYSFIEMHYFLQDNNCENNDFMLRTYDKDLLDFNIHKFFANAGKDEKSKLNDKIITECKKNIWFYMREIVKFYDKDGYIQYPLYMGSPFVLTKENIKLIYLFANGISFTSIYGYDKQSPNNQFDYMNTMRILNTYASDVLCSNNITKIENDDYTKIIDKYPKIRCDYIFGKNNIINKDEENIKYSKKSNNIKSLDTSEDNILFNNFIGVYDLTNIEKINKTFSDILRMLFVNNITKTDISSFEYGNSIQKIYSSVLLDTYKHTMDDFEMLNEISSYIVLKQISYTYFVSDDYYIFDDDISKMSKNHIIIENLY